MILLTPEIEYVDLGSVAEERDFRIANVEYRCRTHPKVRCSEVDYCYCGRRLDPVVPVGLMFIDDDEWTQMLEERNEDARKRRESYRLERRASSVE